MKHSRYPLSRALISASLVFVLAIGGLSLVKAADDPNPMQAVQNAWRRAEQAGVYHFQTEVVQTTYPAPTLTNVGRSSNTESVYMEGQTDTRQRQFLMTLWNESGNVLNGQDGVEVRIDGDKTYGRTSGAEWQEMPDFADAFAPGSDLMAYLAGIKDVREVDESISLPDTPYALYATHYAFTLDGPGLARHVRDQLETELARKGELPAGITLDVSNVYHNATGQGEVWVGADGLPLRLSLHILYPSQDNGEQIEAELKTDFTNFSLTQDLGPVKSLVASLGQLRTAQDWQSVGMQGAMGLSMVGMLLLMVINNRSRVVYCAVALTVIFSMLVAPVLNSVRAAAFMDEQSDKQAAIEQQQDEQARFAEAQAEQADPDWNPHQNPMENIAAPDALATDDPVPAPPSISVLSSESVAAVLSQSSVEDDPYAQCTDEEEATDTDQDLLTDCQEKLLGTNPTQQDSDDDGLWDGWEVLRLGTSPTAFDSDGDGISDNLEVVGFVTGGKHWYSNPNNADTDKDGLADKVECPEHLTIDGITPDVDTPCRDTDGDGTPNLFDLDSDGDQVPDQVDLSPLSVVGQATPFSSTNPFQWKASDFATDSESSYYPVVADFQLRPVNPEHLTYVLNVLDWPSGDEQGQIQRRTGNDATFADAMSAAEREADPRAQNGDVRLVPMLEVELSGDNMPIPFTTDMQTSAQLQGIDTSWPVSSTPPVFTTWLSATLEFSESGTSSAPATVVTTRLAPDSSFEWMSVYAGTCGSPEEMVGEVTATSPTDPFVWTLDGVRLTDVADGNHFAIMSKAGHMPACAQIPDLTTGEYTDRMVDPEPLAAYGVTARDKAESGVVALYVPVNVSPDASGGGRVAFSARMPYFPNNGSLGSAAQKVRLVWMVQTLSDMCKPMPADVTDQDADQWCDYQESWDLNVSQVVHMYSDEWVLTGLSVREDHGFNMAIVWEDPAAKATPEERQTDNWLWPLSVGLEEVFLSGRDADDNGLRDLGVATTFDGATVADDTISHRFDAPLASTVTETLRWGIPTTATLQVETVTYPTQDHVAFVMMTDTLRILNTNFAAYTDATPSLLFAREERYRGANLDAQDTRTIVNDVVTFDLTGQKINTIAAINWAPYRYRDGAWSSFPLAEYWDLLGVRLEAGLPLAADVASDTAEDIRDGQIAVARSYYVALNQGRTGLVAVGDSPLYPYNPLQGDQSLAMSLSYTATHSAYGAAKGAVTVINMIAEAAYSVYQTQIASGGIKFIKGGIAKATDIFWLVGSGLKNTVTDSVTSLLESISGKLNSSAKRGGAIAGSLVGAALLVASIAVGFAFAKVELMLNVCVSVTLAAVQVLLAIKTIYEAATKTLAQITRTTIICGVIGFVIGAVVAFAGAIVTIVAGHLKLSSVAAHAAIADFIAYAIVSAVMLAISLIPVVGQIIAAIIGAFDALVMAICGLASAIVGENVKTTYVGQWLCKGLTGWASEAVKWFIFGARSLTDLQDPDRLQFGRFDYDLDEPDQGMTVGNNLYLTLDLTTTIKLETVLPAGEDVIEGWKNGTNLVPADWKSISYWWQFTDDNVKRSTFTYEIQNEEANLDGVDLDQMTSQWQPAETEHTFYAKPVPESEAIPLDTAGINQPIQATLTEGVDVATQECWTIPNPATASFGPFLPYIGLIPVCVIRGSDNSTHIDLGGRFVLDVLPTTLDEFYEAVERDGGYSLMWGQAGDLPFQRQADFDGDTLLGYADGGSDPDDSQWDTDGDGLSDDWELSHGSDPMRQDSDDDGLTDAEEGRLRTDPMREDSDGDGLTDKEELDGWEIVYAIDASGSQLSTWVTSDPLLPDADYDGLNDFKEKTFGYSPYVPSDANVFSMSAGVQEADAPLLLLRLDEATDAQTFRDYASATDAATCMPDTCPEAGQDGRYAYAAQFGSGDFLSMPNGSVNRTSSNFTVAAWVRPTKVSGNQNILATDTALSNDNGFAFGLSNTDLSFRTYGGSTYSVSTGLQADQWTHVAAVMDSADDVSFYVNGVFQQKIAGTTSTSPDPDDVLVIGATSATDSFVGYLNDVTFFDRTLSASEVKAVMNGRFNLNDTYVQPSQTLVYTATLTNKLMGRYAQGLLSLSATPQQALAGNLDPQTFVLQPLAETGMTGNLTIGPLTTQPISITQAGEALITDWREQSNYAQLWLPLDEASSTTDTDSAVFLDHSGTLPAANGVCSGSTCPTREEPGYFDYALGFNGEQSIILPDTARLGLSDSSFSVSVWINTTDLDSDANILSTSGTPQLRLMLHNGKPAMDLGDSILLSPSQLAANRWYHLVFVYDKERTEATIYVNAEPAANRTGTAAFSATDAVSLGSGWEGRLDDVRTYNRPLSVSEIRELYECPVLRIQFEQMTSSTSLQTLFADDSGLSNGSSCTGSACPSSVSGVTGPLGGQFDGDDTISVAGRPSLDLSDGQFTLSAWVKPDPQPEPVNPACPFSTGYYVGSTPTPTGGCVGWDDWFDPDSGLMLDETTPAGGYTRYYSGEFTFPEGDYDFTLRSDLSSKAILYVDGVQIASADAWEDSASYVESWDRIASNLHTHLSAGVHTIKIDVYSAYGGNRVQFAFNPPYVQGILGEESGSSTAYPSLQIAGRHVRVGFGDGSTWVSRTTTDTVLTADAWNHVVATYNANELIIYVNNARIASWYLDGVKPTDATALRVGASGQLSSVWIDQFHIYDARPGTSGDILTADYSMKWNGSTGADCSWSNHNNGDTVDVDLVKSVDGSGTLEFVHRYLSTDHPLCLRSSDGSEICDSTYNFNANAPGLRFMALEDSNTYTRLYLGDDTHWAYYNDAMPFRGALDDVSIYRHALSAEEIDELYRAAGLALHLKLDEAPGVSTFENSVDLSRQSNAFCASEGGECPTTGVAGRINQATLFDGTSDWLSTTLTLDTVNGGALMAWVRPAASGSITQSVLSTDDGAGGWAIVRDNLRWKVLNGTTLVDTGAAVTPNAWQHVATTLEQGSINFYLDGQLVATVPVNAFDDQVLAVGRKPSGGSYWAGDIDDVRIYMLPPSESEVRRIYQEAPIVHLHLDEPSGATQFSNIVSALSGTCTDCPIAGVTGQAGQAVEFSMASGHTADRITIPADASLNLPRFSVGAWVQPSAIQDSEQVLVSKGDEDIGYNYKLSIPSGGLTATLTLALASGSACGSASSVTGPAQLLANQWNHVMGTYDGETARIYVNGYEQASMALSGEACTTTNDVSIGGLGTDNPFYGRLDEVSLYDHALNAYEVRDMFRYQGKLVQEHRSDALFVDATAPTSALRSYNADLPYLENHGMLMYVEAQDADAGVSQVELLVTKDGGSQTAVAAAACTDSVGDTAWCPFFEPSGEGQYTFATRATDWAGNQSTSGNITLYVDESAPNATLAYRADTLLSARLHPTLSNVWLVDLSGIVYDPGVTGASAPGSGLQPDSIRVALLDTSGEIVGEQAQSVNLAGDTWSLTYPIAEAHPTGRYTVRLEAADAIGNQASLVLGSILVDASAPAGDVQLSTTAITTTQSVQGTASEAPAPRDTALLLHMEESGHATLFYDNAGALRHATCFGNCPDAGDSGIYGSAVHFTGEQGLQVAHSSINEREAGLSIAAWVRPGALSGIQHLVATAQTQSADGFSFGLQDDTLRFTALGSSPRNYDAGTLTRNQWVHVAAIVGDDNSISLYQNGELQTVFTSTLSLQADPDDILLIGTGTSVGSTSPVEHYRGYLDELVIVERAMLPEEVRALAQSQVAGLSSMQAAWRTTLPGSPLYNETPLSGETLHLALDDMPDQSGTLTWQDIALPGSDGQAHHGSCTSTGCPGYGVVGHSGSAASFDGAQTTLTLPNWGTFTTATVSAWVLRTGETGARETIVSYKEAGGCGLVLSLNEDKIHHYPRIWVKVGNSWRYAEQGEPLPLNTWVHLAATYDGATLRLYRDGQLVAGTDAVGGMTQCSATSSVGSRSDSKNHFFPGVIDEVRMFDHALPADTLRERLYLGSEPTLRLTLDESWAADGTRLSDASGWGHDGVLHSGADSTNRATAGAVGGYGLQLDGVDDYVAVEPQSGLLPGSRFSLAAWVYPSPEENDLYPILSSDAYTDTSYAYPTLQVINRTTLVGGFGNGEQALITSTTGVLTENAWNHVAATFDGVTYSLYVNGEQRATTTAFADQRPAQISRFDIGRGEAVQGCATFENLTLTPNSPGYYDVLLDDQLFYHGTSYATPNIPILLNVPDLFCAPITLQVSYKGAVPGSDWQQSITLDPLPSTGSQQLSHPNYSYSADVAWTLAAKPSGMRYWRGGVDDVRVYARALAPLEVAALAQTGWQETALTQSGDGVKFSSWSTDAPSGVEGAFALDLRGTDTAGHVNTVDSAAPAWNGDLDTLAPRVALTLTASGGKYHYTTVAEDFNLWSDGFSSPCGAGVINTTGTYQSPWYLATVGQSGLADKVYRLTADCTMDMLYGLAEVGAWTDRSVAGGFAIAGTQAYVPSGALWHVDLSNPISPNDLSSTNASGDGRGVAVVGNRAYIADGSRGLTVVNLSNPSATPGRLDTPGTATDVIVQDNYAYLADGSGGVRIIDIADPTDPQLVGTYQTDGDAVAIGMAPALVSPLGAGKALPALVPEAVNSAVPFTSREDVTVSYLPVGLSPALSDAANARRWAGYHQSTAPSLVLPSSAQIKPLAESTTLSLTVQSGGVLAPTAAQAGEQFGAALSVYNDYLVVGAPHENGTAAENGIVYLWRYHPVFGTWMVSNTLSASASQLNLGVGGEHFGSAVAISSLSGNAVPDLLVGAPDETMASDASGMAYRFRTNEPWNPNNGQWVVTQTVQGSMMEDHAGYAVAQLGPDAFVVGIPADPSFEGGSVYAGNTYPYLWDLGGRFGAALALSGNTLVVGAPDLDYNATITTAGAAKVYTYTYDELTPSYTWAALPLTLTSPVPATGARFGTSVDIDDDTIVMGTDAGAAYVFLQNQGGADAWGQVATLSPTDVLSGGFGTAVVVADDRIAVGAPFTEVAGSAEQGAVYLFLRNYDPANPGVPAPDNWGLATIITRTDGSAGDHFGAALAAYSDTLVIGAPAASSTGRAYVYYLDFEAPSDAYAATEDTALEIAAPGVLSNDTVGTRTHVTATVESAPAHGDLTLQPDGAFTYTPSPNYHGPDSFTYRLLSDVSSSNVTTVTLTVQSVNDAPSAVSIQEMTEEELPIQIPIVYVQSQYVSDADDDTLTITGLGTPANGSATTDSATVTYTPSLNFAGIDDFTYTVADPGGLEATAYITVTVHPVNDAPTATDISVATNEDTPVAISPFPVHATDVDGDPLTVIEVGTPVSGTSTTNDETIIYTPTLGFVGTDAFTYTVRDPGDLEATAWITVAVNDVNDPPAAVDDTTTTNEDTPCSIAVLDNDSDPDGQTLSLSAVGTPLQGDATIEGSTLRYVPMQDLYGTDAFTYTINDGALSATGWVTVTIQPVNDPPTVSDIPATTDEEVPVEISPFPAYATDVDGDPLTITGLGSPTNGTATTNGITVTYTPTLNFVGTDAFTYTVSDAGGAEATAQIAVHVWNVNDPPVAVDDAVTTNEDTPCSIAALNNDSDPDGGTPWLATVGAPLRGQATIVGDTLRYTPTLNLHGTDTFTYTIKDTALYATATVTVVVSPVNDAPTLDAIGALALDEDAATQTVILSGIGTGAADEVQTLTVTAQSSDVSLIPHPVVAYTSTEMTGTLSFTPLADLWGTATLTITVSDGLSTTLGTIPVTVNSVNDAPVATDISIATDEDVPITVAPYPVYASDVEGDVTVVSLGIPTDGTATTDGVTITYTPTLDFVGDAVFTYAVQDLGGLQASAWITVQMGGVNDAPVAVDDVFTTNEDMSLTLTVLSNDSDVDGQTPFLTTVGTPLLGKVTIAGSLLHYTPTLDLHGTDAFTYTISDGTLDATATVTVVVASVNDAPTLNAISDRTLNEDAGVQTIALSDIGSGATNEAQTLIVTAQSSNAVLIPDPTITYTSPQTSGILRFTPVADLWGAATVTVTVSDGISTTVRAFQVTVNAVNDAPTLNAIAAITLDEDAGEQTVALTDIGSGAANEPQSLAITAQSSNVTLIPNPTVTYTSPQTTGVLCYTPAANEWGNATITVTVSDGVSTTVRAFLVTVNALNDAPTLAAIGNLTLNEDPGQQTVALTGISTGAANEAQPLTVTAQSSNGSLIPTPAVTYSTPQTSGTLRFTPAANQWGSASFTVTVSDGISTTVRVFQVTVNPVNDAPTLNVLSNRTINEDAGQQTVSLTGISTGADNEVQTIAITAQSSNPALIPTPSVTYVSPEVSGTLRFTPVANGWGSATITVTAGDSEGLTTVRTFLVTVTPVDDKPTLDPLPDFEMGQDASPQVIALSGISSEVVDAGQPLTVTAKSSNPALVSHPDVIYTSPQTTGQLRLTPAPGQTGVTTITVSVSDGITQTTRAFQVTVWPLVGPFAYLAMGERDLLVMDMGQPASPHRLSAVALSGEVNDVVVRDSRAFVAAGAAGLLILDITTPSNPQLLGSLDTAGYAMGVAISGTLAYIADGYAGIRMINISDMTAPVLHATYNTPGYATKVEVMETDHYVGVADSNGGLRVLDTLALDEEATACDMFGNCTTVSAVVAPQVLALSAQSGLGVSLLDVPPVLDSLDPLTITGEAFATLSPGDAVSSLRALTVTVDGSMLYTTTWAQDALTRTLWSTAWDPSTRAPGGAYISDGAYVAEGTHALQAYLADWAGDVATTTQSVIVDTRAPEISITPLITSTHFHTPEMLDLTGVATDAGGIKSLLVTVATDSQYPDETLPGTLAQGTWHAAWSLGGRTLFDGEALTVTARALDVGGHTTLVTETVVVDLMSPAPVTLTMMSGGAVITPGLTLRSLTGTSDVSPTLELAWTESNDGSGIAAYHVEWTAALTSTQRIVSQTCDLGHTTAFTPNEGEQVWAHIASEDVYGQQSWQSSGPFYVDSSTTPDYTLLKPGSEPYRGWMESDCTLVGVDRRLNRQASPGAALSAAQALYASWDVEALRLAWTGADWETDGDLFVYLDTREGGTVTLLNPYETTTPTIYLPGATPTSTANAMAADYVVWVSDEATALLFAWQGESWDWVMTLDGSQYRFEPAGQEYPTPITDLRLPFALLDIVDPANTALEMIALASEDDALRLWATLPNANPVNSTRVAQLHDESESGEYALTQAYQWAHLSAGVCPNGSDGVSTTRYPDTEVRARLSVEPAGVVYSYMGDNLLGLWAALLEGQTPDINTQLSWLSSDYPRVGANQTLTYELSFRNLGTDVAHNVWVDLQSYYTLRFNDGSEHRTLVLGDLAPGQEKSAAFTGEIDLGASTLSWAGVLAEVYDEQHGADGEPLERIWADHQVDRIEPQFLGIQQPEVILTAGRNTLRGYVYDASPVPVVTLEVDGHGSVTCPDTAPSDGMWACELDTTGTADGEILDITLSATDIHGQVGSTGAPQAFVVDTIPPTITLDPELSQAAPGSSVQGTSVRLNGQATDNHGLAQVEACMEGACTLLDMDLATPAGAVVVEDAPATPVIIDADNRCSGGTAIVRTFNVTESFTLGAVNVGLVAAHTHRDDLLIELESPTGVRVRLLADDGVSGTHARHYNVLLDDAAPSSYSSGGDDDPAMLNGAFDHWTRPLQPLRAFVGQPAQGQWTLTMCDTNPAADDGDYRRSRLILTPQAGESLPRTGDWSYTLFGNDEMDAVERTVLFYGVDLAGNRTAPLTARYIFDNVGPVITVTDILNTARYDTSLSVLAGTVTDGGEVASMVVLVENDEMITQEPVEIEDDTWHYNLHPLALGTYTLRIRAYDTAGNVTSSGPFQVEVMPQREPYVTHLPLIFKNHVAASDLVVETFVVSETGVQIAVRNTGSSAVADAFWVDLYIDPDPVPTTANQIWSDLAAQGLVWGVTTPLGVGEVLTLTQYDTHYRSDCSEVVWPLPVGTPIFVQVDSANAGTDYGGVQELHEILGMAYNNVASTTVVAETMRSVRMGMETRDGSPSVSPTTGGLPRRRWGYMSR